MRRESAYKQTNNCVEQSVDGDAVQKNKSTNRSPAVLLTDGVTGDQLFDLSCDVGNLFQGLSFGRFQSHTKKLIWGYLWATTIHRLLCCNITVALPLQAIGRICVGIVELGPEWGIRARIWRKGMARGEGSRSGMAKPVYPPPYYPKSANRERPLQRMFGTRLGYRSTRHFLPPARATKIMTPQPALPTPPPSALDRGSPQAEKSHSQT